MFIVINFVLLNIIQLCAPILLDIITFLLSVTDQWDSFEFTIILNFCVYVIFFFNSSNYLTSNYIMLLFYKSIRLVMRFTSLRNGVLHTIFFSIYRVLWKLFSPLLSSLAAIIKFIYLYVLPVKWQPLFKKLSYFGFFSNSKSALLPIKKTKNKNSK